MKVTVLDTDYADSSPTSPNDSLVKKKKEGHYLYCILC